jgi:hypothetical protein
MYSSLTPTFLDLGEHTLCWNRERQREREQYKAFTAPLWWLWSIFKNWALSKFHFETTWSREDRRFLTLKWSVRDFGKYLGNTLHDAFAWLEISYYRSLKIYLLGYSRLRFPENPQVWPSSKLTTLLHVCPYEAFPTFIETIAIFEWNLNWVHS